MRKQNNRQGFTLIEVLVVIGIIAILAAIVIIAINPRRQFQQANNTQRWSNVNAVLNAVHQYAVEHNGQFPPGINGTAQSVCQSGVASTTCTGASLLPIDEYLSPTYLVSLPVDPTCVTANSTCYTIATTSTDRIVVAAPLAEQGEVVQVQR